METTMRDAALEYTQTGLSGTTAIILDKHIDLSVARRIGPGTPLLPFLEFIASGGTSPTAFVEVFQASDLAGAGLEVLSRSAVVSIANAGDGAAGNNAPVPIPLPPLGINATRLQYLGFRVTMAGTSPTGSVRHGLEDQKISGPTVGYTH
jgi:hypothetical protein